MKCFTTAGVLMVAGVLACGGDQPPVAPPSPISVTFKNQLRLPVTITADGTTPTVVNGTSTIVFPSGTTSATWSEQDETYLDGTPVPDDLGPTTILVANQATLTISNVVGTTTYFEPYLTNSSGVTVAVAIVQGSTVRCLGTQATGGGAVRWGYYRIAAQTEWRVYKPGTNCTGTYQFWSSSTISGAMFGSGTVLLDATTPP